MLLYTTIWITIVTIRKYLNPNGYPAVFQVKGDAAERNYFLIFPNGPKLFLSRFNVYGLDSFLRKAKLSNSSFLPPLRTFSSSSVVATTYTFYYL